MYIGEMALFVALPAGWAGTSVLTQQQWWAVVVIVTHFNHHRYALYILQNKSGRIYELSVVALPFLESECAEQISTGKLQH